MPTVIIDQLPSSAEKYRDDWTIIVVDVIRFTTTATTAVHLGRSVYPAGTIDDAYSLAERFANPLLVGELGGNVPYGFHVTNSPVQMVAHHAVPCGAFTSDDRPIIMISSSGAQLLVNAASATDVYLGCLRNITALSSYVAERHDKVAVLGAGTRGVFRREDQLCCAWIAAQLEDLGFECSEPASRRFLDYWKDHDAEVIREGKSAEYLTTTGQAHDLEFVIHYQDDLTVVPKLVDGGKLVDAAKIRERKIEIA
jgi:2-phosphosulfolactate phosphatase